MLFNWWVDGNLMFIVYIFVNDKNYWVSFIYYYIFIILSK